MSIHRLLSQACGKLIDANGGGNATARDLGRSPATISRIRGESYTALFNLAEVAELQASTGCTFVSDALERCATMEPVDDSPQTLALRLQAELGRLAGQIVEAEADGHFDYREAKDAHDQVKRLQAACKDTEQKILQIMTRHMLRAAE